MIRRILTGIAVIVCCNAFSQTRMDNWAFGDSAGIKFNAGYPEFLHTKITTYESSAAISDDEGNLLFYSNGETIWNQENQIMENGESLGIGQIMPGLGSSVTQGVVIVPFPNSESKYYVIVNHDVMGDSEDGLQYSVVDMELDGGLGAVTEKNVQFYFGYLLEKMQAVKHGNGKDWWLMVHNGKFGDTISYFIRFLITQDGIGDAQLQADENPDILSLGQMKFSQDGNKLAYTRKYSTITLYEFNRCTGMLTNPISIVTGEYGIYGCEFSPDGNKLYVANCYGSFGEYYHNFLVQYCLNCPETIETTKDTIYQFEFPEHAIGQLQLGPDKRIYLPFPWIHANDSVYTEINTFLSVINDPNNDGFSCDFDTLTIAFSNSRNTGALPNMPNYSLGPLVGSECDTLLAISTPSKPSGIHFYPNPASDQIYFSGYAAYNGSHVQLYLYNLLGEEVFTMRNIPFNTAIQLPELTNGLYEVVLKNGKRRLFADELIIQK